jgi:alcohol/geraniol dehydrogenase (NADP+)
LGSGWLVVESLGRPARGVKMLDFAARHGVEPVTEVFSFAQVNEALKHLHADKARYRIVLKH